MSIYSKVTKNIHHSAIYFYHLKQLLVKFTMDSMKAISSIAIPSSSFSPQTRWTYDVFLSFRGEDTRDNFVSHLYTALDQKGIYTFKDDEKLERGTEISTKLVKAIEESRFSIVVLSKNYASSRWCLDELVKILEWRNVMGQTVCPVFYHVNPSEVRRQSGRFGKGFAKLASMDEMEKVQKWREALEQVANLSGWLHPSSTNWSESKFIQVLVGKISTALNHTYLSVVEDLVGMNSRTEEVIELLGLGLDDARVIGIWGMGGMGKTTIARAVYDRIAYQFEGHSFIENVRDVSKKSGIKTLQEQLISEILMEKDFKVGNIGMGISMIKNRVCQKKVFIVLDDVDESIELETLVGKHHWFGFGSRIIITTRDKHMLTSFGIKHVYKVDGLNKDEAKQLFNSKAFGKGNQMGGYRDLLDCAVEYAKGVPLALKVLGSFLFGRNKGEWESALNKLKECPDKEVGQVLRISYDALDWKEKEIFLDIACFFKGKDKNEVTKILDSCNFNPVVGINVLIEKSLVTISNNKLSMHDLIQKLGWDIVRQESPREPGKRSRLWLFEDMYHVLTNNTGTQAVEGIIVEGENPDHVWPKQLKLSPKAFANMTELRFLKICCGHLPEGLQYLPNKLRYFDWCQYPLTYMPSTFQPKHIVELNITYSRIEQLWKGKVLLEKLRVLNLSFSIYLTKSPDFTGVPNLERLILEGCTSLVNLHPSIGVLKRLICLNLKDCKNLKSIPNGICFDSLQILIVSGCSKLKNILGSFGYMKCLSELYMDGTGLRELPPSVEHFTNLALINLRDCQNLRSLPNNICQLNALQTLNLSGCSKLDKLPEDLGVLDCLKELYADWTAIRQTPTSIVLLKNLETLSFQGCNKRTTSNSWSSFFLSLFLLRRGENSMSLELPALSGFNSLKRLNLRDCNLKLIPIDICLLHSLESLGLSGNDFECLPASINQLSNLQYLSVTGCKMLQELPELASTISTLTACNCESLQTISSPSKYNNIEGFWFTNCSKLAENKHSNILTDAFLSNQFQGSYGEQRKFLNIIFPGSEVPKWFSHQNDVGMGSLVSFMLPPNWYNRRFLGFALCAAVGLMDDTLLKLGVQISIGKRLTHCLPYITCVVKSETLWVGYISCHFLDLDQLEVDELNEGGIEFVAYFIRRDDIDIVDGCTGYKYNDKLEYLMHVGVKNCGIRLVYYNEYDDDEAAVSNSMYSSQVNNFNSSVFYGDSDRSSVVAVEDEDSTAITTSKRRRDDLSDCEPPEVEPNGSSSFEVDHSSKRSRVTS
ncbi:unnamed protein product [Camellia sinensis]